MPKPKIGTVYLVGAGPGDPGLLTRRAAELLARASVVIHDALVPVALHRLARPGAEILDAASLAGSGPATREALLRLLIDRARAGHAVVHLKGGDPFVFGRGAEEAAALAAAGVPFEIVPGVSSFGAAAACAGIPLTHRACASAFTVVTGHLPPGSPESPVDWAELARQHGTKVVLMGVDNLGPITAALQAGGLDPTTPAAAIRWGATPAQQVVEGTLADLAQRAAEARLQAPAVLLFGDVVRQRSTLNWFEKRPLFGRRIVVPRTREHPSSLAPLLAELGARVLEIPTVRRETPAERGPMIESLAGLGEYDWVVFIDGRGVDAFFEALLAAFQDIRAIGNARLATVGAEPLERLAAVHLRADATPSEATGPEIARAIEERETLENLRVLLVRAAEPNPDLIRDLEDRGAIVDDVSFYRTVPLPPADDPEGVLAELREHGADWIAFPSSTAVRQLDARLPLADLLRRRPGLRLASIGPETTRSLAALGLRPAAEARAATLPALADALATR